MEPSIYKNLKKANKTQENRTNRVRAEISYRESIWKKREKAKLFHTSIITFVCLLQYTKNR